MILAKDNDNGNQANLSGENYDRVFCRQGWDQKVYTKSKVKEDKLSSNQEIIRVGVSKLALVKGNRKWIIAKINCE